MMKSISAKIKNFEGKWVAFDRASNDVVASGDTLKELNLKVARQDRAVILFKVPRLDVNLVPLQR